MCSDAQTASQPLPILPTCVLRRAKAGVVINPIDTRRIVFTVIIFTVINIDFTMFSFKSISTNTPARHRGKKVKNQNQANKTPPCILKPYGLNIGKNPTYTHELQNF